MTMYLSFILICCCFKQIFSVPDNGNTNNDTNITDFHENSQNLPTEINSSLQQDQSMTSASNEIYEELIDQHKVLESDPESKGQDPTLGSGMEPDNEKDQGSGMGLIFTGHDQDQGSGMGPPFTEGQNEDLGLGSGFEPFDRNEDHSSGIDHEKKN
ncbi:uncharacterized protein LOC143809645 [Ranitomeya variabilis]|uniref:uncharacterized protein LOC143809645 n=1 Tax=Ranitomeya variabilis TaxID=490064 RepID=UPI0040579B05